MAKEEEKEITTETSEGEYSCPECGKEFKNLQGLAGHRRHVHQIDASAEPKSTAGIQIKVSDYDTFFPVMVWLPSTIFALYHYAKRAKLSNHPTIVEFLCEYCEYGFKKAHEGYGLTLAPVEAKPNDSQEIDTLKAQLEEQNKILKELMNLIAQKEANK